MPVIKLLEPWKHQQAVIDHPAKNKLLIFGRRGGKTEGCCTYLILKALQHKGLYYWVAPDLVQARVAEGILKQALSEVCSYSYQLKTFHLPNGSDICIRTAENDKALRGQGLDGLIIDEAAFIKASVYYEALLPSLKDKNGWSVLASTPNGHNWLFDLYQTVKDNPEWVVFRFPSWISPLMNKEELEKEKEIMGVNKWNQEYGGEFVAKGMALFDPKWFDSIFVNSIPTSPQRSVVAVDLSMGKLKSDYQAVVYVAFQDGKIYCDCWANRVSIDVLSTVVESTYVKYKEQGCQGICIETNGFQQLFADNFSSQFPEVPTYHQVNTVNKEIRISRLASWLSNGNLKLLDNAGGRLALKQLMDFPVGSHDDLPDCLECGIRCLIET